MLRCLYLITGCLTLLFSLALATSNSGCSDETFAHLLSSNAQIISTQLFGSSSTFNAPASDIGFPGNSTDLPGFCSVEISIITSSSSVSTFGLWLPTEGWNERFLAVGNAAFAGGINYLDMGVGLRYGFASMSTDTGHSSTQVQLQWGNNATERKNDWGYRAMHVSVEMAKSLVEAYYGCAAHHSYFSGCSTGGRQGLKEIQDHPESFDGILVGAPAWWLEHLQPASVAVALPNLPANSSNNIPIQLFPIIAAEVYKQCDAADGLKDGIIQNPILCHFDAEALLCAGSSSNASACLTRSQLHTLKTFYETIYDKGRFVWTGFAYGSEYQWYFLLGADVPSPLGTGWIQDFLLNDPEWAYQTYTNDLVFYAEESEQRAITGNGTPDNFDLSPYHARGGKVLHYHGYSDALVVPQSSFIFYQKVLNTLAPRGIDLDSFYRLFPIPGMQHCFTSPPQVNAPWYIAGAQQADFLTPSGQHSVPGYEDKEHDALLALMAWVEDGIAPDSIIATKFVNDSVSKGVLRQRPICPFPKEAQYHGSGDPDVAENWSCQEGLLPFINFDLDLEIFESG